MKLVIEINDYIYRMLSNSFFEEICKRIKDKALNIQLSEKKEECIVFDENWEKELEPEWLDNPEIFLLMLLLETLKDHSDYIISMDMPRFVGKICNYVAGNKMYCYVNDSDKIVSYFYYKTILFMRDKPESSYVRAVQVNYKINVFLQELPYVVSECLINPKKTKSETTLSFPVEMKAHERIRLYMKNMSTEPMRLWKYNPNDVYYELNHCTNFMEQNSISDILKDFLYYLTEVEEWSRYDNEDDVHERVSELALKYFADKKDKDGNNIFIETIKLEKRLEKNLYRYYTENKTTVLQLISEITGLYINNPYYSPTIDEMISELKSLVASDVIYSQNDDYSEMLSACIIMDALFHSFIYAEIWSARVSMNCSMSEMLEKFYWKYISKSDNPVFECVNIGTKDNPDLSSHSSYQKTFQREIKRMKNYGIEIYFGRFNNHKGTNVESNFICDTMTYSVFMSDYAAYRGKRKKIDGNDPQKLMIGINQWMNTLDPKLNPHECTIAKYLLNMIFDILGQNYGLDDNTCEKYSYLMGNHWLFTIKQLAAMQKETTEDLSKRIIDTNTIENLICLNTYLLVSIKLYSEERYMEMWDDFMKFVKENCTLDNQEN